jgi:hypothetical protein
VVVALLTLGVLELAGAFSSGSRVVIANPPATKLPVFEAPLQVKDPGPAAARASEQIADGVLNQIPAGLAVAHAGRGKRWVALTFDDGPSKYTLQVLRLLERAHQHATFFVTGYAATTYPFQLKQIRAGGNAFGDHTVTHTQLTREKPARRRWELISTAERVQAVTGVRPTLFRPPYGESSRAINTMARTLGMLARRQADRGQRPQGSRSRRDHPDARRRRQPQRDREGAEADPEGPEEAAPHVGHAAPAAQLAATGARRPRRPFLSLARYRPRIPRSRK